MVEENIYNYLVSISGLIALVDTKSIGWEDVEQDELYPKVVYKIIDNPTYNEVDNYIVTDAWQRWRFYIFSKEKFECQEIADVLTANLHRAFGDIDGRYFDLISKISESDFIISDGATGKTYEKYLDFRIIYH